MINSAPGRLTIDSIQHATVRVELHNGSVFDLPREWLPLNIEEGDVVTVNVDTADTETKVSFTIDQEATAETRKRIMSKLDQLREREK